MALVTMKELLHRAISEIVDLVLSVWGIWRWSVEPYGQKR